jgi:HAD superfamily hydrolase (TIGR01490 family)
VEAAFFDLDKTVIAKASMVAFGGTFQRAGFINRRLLLRAAWSGLVFHHLGADDARMHRFRESALRVTKGWDQARISAVVHETLTDVIGPIVYNEAIDEMDRHRSEGRRIYLVSASPTEIVEPLGAYLGVDESIASRARVDADGRYTGEVEIYAYGPFKAEAVRDVASRDGIDLEGSWAYSDSVTDLPLLEVVGHPVAVNPDRALAREARRRGWELRTFRHPVPLRERVPMPGPGRVALVATVATAALAGSLAGWWLSGRERTARPSSGERCGSGASVRRPAAS